MFDLSDQGDSMTDGIDDSALQEAAKRITKTYQKRLAREMAGAAMAGYDALDAIKKAPLTSPNVDPRKGGMLDGPLSMKVAFIPRDDVDAPTSQYVPSGFERYDLRDLDPSGVRELRRIARGDAWGDDDV